MTSKFQPLDLTVNKATKSFISEKYNAWMAKKVAKQLKEGKAPLAAGADLGKKLRGDLYAGLYSKIGSI